MNERIRKGLVIAALGMLVVSNHVVYAKQASEVRVTEATTQMVNAQPGSTEATTQTVSAQPGTTEVPTAETATANQQLAQEKPGTPVVTGEYIKKKVQLKWEAADKAHIYLRRMQRANLLRLRRRIGQATKIKLLRKERIIIIR